MKKLLTLFTLFVLLMLSIPVEASDIVSEFKIGNDGYREKIVISVGTTCRVNFYFKPEGSIGEVSLDTTETIPDTNIAEISVQPTYALITGKSLGTTKFCLTCPTYYNGVNYGVDYRYIEVEVTNTQFSLSSSISKIEASYVDNLVYYMNLTFTPNSAIDFLNFYSDDSSVVNLSQNYQDKTRFSIKILKPGTTQLHFIVGNAHLIIPVIIKENSVENYPDAPLPEFVSKSTIKDAYDKYVKQYNTPFQDNKGIFNDYIDDLRYSSDVIDSKCIKKAENLHSFFRVITGGSPVTYTSELSKKAALGSDFMDKYNQFSHFAADGIDEKAAQVLHSSNIFRNSMSVYSTITGFMGEVNNVAGAYNVGHRIWMLDNTITNWGIAKTGIYFDQFYDKTNLDYSKSKVIAYPARGYFPIEGLNNDKNVDWSIQLGNEYAPYIEDDNLKVFVTNQKGETIELSDYRKNPTDPNGCFCPNTIYGDGYAICFYPKKFVNIDNSSGLEHLIGQTFTIRIEGLKKSVANSYNYVPCGPLEYSTTFISIEEEGWNPSVDTSKTEYINLDTGKPLESEINLEVGQEINIQAKIKDEPGIKIYYRFDEGDSEFFWTYFKFTRDNDDPSKATLTALTKGSFTIGLGINGVSAEKDYKLNIINPKTSNDDTNNEPTKEPDNNTKPPSQNDSNQSQSSVEVYRLYNETSKEHLFTTDKNEVKVLSTQHGWTDEGHAWTSPGSGEGVYRLYCSVTGAHLYTKDLNEMNTLKQSGIWTVDNNNKPLIYSGGSKPIYRLYHEGIKMHLLTTDQNEYHTLGTRNWNKESVALYALD